MRMADTGREPVTKVEKEPEFVRIQTPTFRFASLK